MQRIVLFSKKRVCAYNSIKIPCQIIKNKKIWLKLGIFVYKKANKLFRNEESKG